MDRISYTPIHAGRLEDALNYVRRGGRLVVRTYGHVTIIASPALSKVVAPIICLWEEEEKRLRKEALGGVSGHIESLAHGFANLGQRTMATEEEMRALTRALQHLDTTVSTTPKAPPHPLQRLREFRRKRRKCERRPGA